MRRLPGRFAATGGAVLLGMLLMGLIPLSRQEGSGPLLVTSSLGANSAILFVLDPDGGTLAAYEAVPQAAGEGEGGLSLLGARRIEADLRLTKYRDRSEFSYEELRSRYEAGRGEEGSEGDSGKDSGAAEGTRRRGGPQDP